MERVVDIFLKLVKIPSPSKHEDQVAQFITNHLKKLGYKVKKDAKGNLIVNSRGMRKYGPIIMFSAHMDTVPPADKITPIIKGKYIYSDGTSVLGSDDKSGIAAIIELLHRIKKDKILYKEIKAVFTVEEEIDLLGAKALKKSDVKADMCYVLDAGGDAGTVVNKAPYLNSIQIDVLGKASHAGAEPELGIHAIQLASEAIANLKLGRIDDETTVNIGTIVGGVAQNIIPEKVSISAEVRSHKLAKLEKQTKLIKNAFQKSAAKYKGKVKVNVKRKFDGLDVSPKSVLVKLVEKSAKNLKLPFIVETGGGGSDAQMLTKLGIPTVVLGTGMENVHSTKERIKIKNLVDLADLLVEIVKIGNS